MTLVYTRGESGRWVEYDLKVGAGRAVGVAVHDPTLRELQGVMLDVDGDRVADLVIDPRPTSTTAMVRNLPGRSLWSFRSRHVSRASWCPHQSKRRRVGRKLGSRSRESKPLALSSQRSTISLVQMILGFLTPYRYRVKMVRSVGLITAMMVSAVTFGFAAEKCDKVLEKAQQKTVEGGRLGALEKALSKCPEHVPTLVATASTLVELQAKGEKGQGGARPSLDS